MDVVPGLADGPAELTERVEPAHTGGIERNEIRQAQVERRCELAADDLDLEVVLLAEHAFTRRVPGGAGGVLEADAARPGVDDLRDLAKQLDVPNRSTITDRDELVVAIRRRL